MKKATVDIQPRNDLVLIERLDDAPKSAIVIPEVAKERGLKGKVLAVGPGKLVEGVNGGLVRKPVEVRPGDIVYFNSKWNEFAGSHFSGEEMIGTPAGLHLIYEADIFLKESNAR